MKPANNRYIWGMATNTRDHGSEDCRPISDILSRIGDKWTILVLRALGEQRLRFTEIHRKVGGISQRMLTVTLRGLERDGLVSRTVHATIPPKVEYEVTERGQSLQRPLCAVAEWATENREGIEASRRAFDGSEQTVSDGEPTENA